MFGPWPFIGAFVVGGVLVRQLRQPIEQIIAGVDHRADELKTLAVLMARLERERFESPALRALRAALDSDGMPARRGGSRSCGGWSTCSRAVATSSRRF